MPSLGFANPTRFHRLSGQLTRPVGWAALSFMAVGFGWGFLLSPPDYQQHDTVRIMYLHVPSAWMAMFVYVFVALMSLLYLVWRHALADILARAASPVGAVFTVLALITGALWGRPMWGAWWVWDARLTSVLVLLFLYLGHIALANAFDDRERGAKAAAILALVGIVNIPVIKFSVDWWATLHQPASVLRLDGPTIHTTMLVPLLLSAFGFALFFFFVLLLRARSEIIGRKIHARRLRQSAG
jgi:heme exporter protein C